MSICILVSLVAHRFGRVKFQIFVVVFTLEKMKTNIQDSKFEIRHVQINELPRTLLLNTTENIYLTIFTFQDQAVCICIDILRIQKGLFNIYPYASRNYKWSICWKFQLSILLGTQKVSHLGIHIWESCSPFWWFDKI